jgi:hypothetical protein
MYKYRAVRNRKLGKGPASQPAISHVTIQPSTHPFALSFFRLFILQLRHFYLHFLFRGLFPPINITELRSRCEQVPYRCVHPRYSISLQIAAPQQILVKIFMSILSVVLKSLNADKEETRATLTGTILQLFAVKRRSQRTIFSALLHCREGSQPQR